MTEKFEQLIDNLPLSSDTNLDDLVERGEITEEERDYLIKANDRWINRGGPLGQTIRFERVR